MNLNLTMDEANLAFLVLGFMGLLVSIPVLPPVFKWVGFFTVSTGVIGCIFTTVRS
jgi:hypothetical protein